MAVNFFSSRTIFIICLVAALVKLQGVVAYPVGPTASALLTTHDKEENCHNECARAHKQYFYDHYGNIIFDRKNGRSIVTPAFKECYDDCMMGVAPGHSN